MDKMEKTVWLVGADYPYQEFLSAYVAERGFEVNRFFSVKECFDQASPQSKPEMIMIMDLPGGDKSSAEAFTVIAAVYSDIPVLHLTTIKILAMAQEFRANEGVCLPVKRLTDQVSSLLARNS